MNSKRGQWSLAVDIDRVTAETVCDQLITSWSTTWRYQQHRFNAVQWDVYTEPSSMRSAPSLSSHGRPLNYRHKSGSVPQADMLAAYCLANTTAWCSILWCRRRIKERLEDSPPRCEDVSCAVSLWTLLGNLWINFHDILKREFVFVENNRLDFGTAQKFEGSVPIFWCLLPWPSDIGIAL